MNTFPSCLVQQLPTLREETTVDKRYAAVWSQLPVAQCHCRQSARSDFQLFSSMVRLHYLCFFISSSSLLWIRCDFPTILILHPLPFLLPSAHTRPFGTM